MSRPRDVEWNIDHHRALAARSVEERIDLVVFPELSLTGYEPEAAARLAFEFDDQRLAPLTEAIASSSTILIVGAPIRSRQGLHIGAFILAAGHGPRIYTKRCLAAGEEKVFAPGTLDPLVQVGPVPAGIAICADATRPEHAAAAAARGAALYIAGVFLGAKGYEVESRRFSRYAAQYSMAVVMANAGVPSSHGDSAGGSAVWCESGRIVSRLEGPGAGWSWPEGNRQGGTGKRSHCEAAT